MHMSLGIGCLVVGAALIFWTNRRVFQRRNAAGVEEFASYGHSLLTRTVERLARILAWLLILAGVVWLLLLFFQINR